MNIRWKKLRKLLVGIGVSLIAREFRRHNHSTRMNNVGIYTDLSCLEHKTPFPHCENQKRIQGVLDELKNGKKINLNNFLFFDGVFLNNRINSVIRSTHSLDYLDYLENTIKGIKGTEVKQLYDPVIFDDGGTFVSKNTLNTVNRVANIVSKSLDDIKMKVINDGFCLIRPPGHHTTKNMGMGFSIYNNIAIGAKYAQSIGYKKVMIIDFDLHHGNGTQDIFYEDNSVYYFSTFRQDAFPRTGNEHDIGKGEGIGYNQNIILPNGCSNQQLLRIYSTKLKLALGQFNPDIILISAGYDLHKDDFLSNTTVDDIGILGMVDSICSNSGTTPLLFLLEGGYNIGVLKRNVRNTLSLLLSR